MKLRQLDFWRVVIFCLLVFIFLVCFFSKKKKNKPKKKYKLLFFSETFSRLVRKKVGRDSAKKDVFRKDTVCIFFGFGYFLLEIFFALIYFFSLCWKKAYFVPCTLYSVPSTLYSVKEYLLPQKDTTSYPLSHTFLPQKVV